MQGSGTRISAQAWRGKQAQYTQASASIPVGKGLVPTQGMVGSGAETGRALQALLRVLRLCLEDAEVVPRESKVARELETFPWR